MNTVKRQEGHNFFESNKRPLLKVLSLKPLVRGIVILFFSSLFIFYFSTYLPLPASLLSPMPMISLEIRDRHGIRLREVLSDIGGRCRWLKLENISPYLIKATIAAEDKYFFFHPGINILSLARATYQNISKGQIVSGGSTISQQLARNLLRRRRHLLTKLEETWLALRLEHYHSKEQILEQYLNRIYYGNQAYGAEAASQLYFGKSCSELTLAEASFLAILPRSPKLFDPYRLPQNSKAIKNAQAIILKRLSELGFCQQEEAKKALEENVKIIPADRAFRAPHFCNWILSQIPPDLKPKLSVIQTTLDYNLQAKIEALLRQHIHSLSPRRISNGAVIVLDNQTAEVLVMIGSKDFFDEKEGQINGALARRQPGSTLKPFTYALALEKGLTAASILEDRPASFPAEGGAYTPFNFDRQFHGYVNLRTALACSYNIPAVSLVNWFGPELLWRKLRELGFESLNKPAEFYGVGLTLGNGEVTLLELVRAYSSLARQGQYRPHKIFLNFSRQTNQKIERLNLERTKGREKREEFFQPINELFLKKSDSNDDFTGKSQNLSKQVFSPQIAYIITDILSDQKARVPSFGHHTPLAFPFPVAVKTGTSEDFRDNWAIGYTPKYTVGVWVGNFDGEPMGNVSGICGSGPLFRDIILLLNRSSKEWSQFEYPEGLIRINICPDSGELATSACPGRVKEIFIRGTEPKSFCSLHLRKSSLSKLKVQFSSEKRLTVDNSSINLKSPSSLPEFNPIYYRPLSHLKNKTVINIVFPRDGDVFKIDPILPLEHQALKLRAMIDQEFSKKGKIEWWANGLKIGESKPTSGFFWNLKPGIYHFQAKLITETIIVESTPITIKVLPLSKEVN
ncbi:MAG: penicillin-binding protein 1C [Candidatus Aminicenantes bacterium]|nr:penicillin-binding protein 1C [Candidatus Aminicenantes bacterium]